MSIGEILEPLVVAHARKFDTDPHSIFPVLVECHEPLDCPGKINTRTDDWVFIMESDDIVNGILSLYPCHRGCMTAAWGEDHVIPPRNETPHAKFARQLVTEGPAIGDTRL